MCDVQVKTTNPKKYCVRPNTGVVSPRSTCDIMGVYLNLYAVVLNMCLWKQSLDFYVAEWLVWFEIWVCSNCNLV